MENVMKVIKKNGHNFAQEHESENKQGRNINPKKANQNAPELISPPYLKGVLSSKGHGTLGHSNNTRTKNNPNRTRSKFSK